MIRVLLVLWFLCLPSVAHAQEKLTIETAQGKSHVFKVDMAITRAAQEQGLMNRKTLPADYGMLFVNAAPTVSFFWMKNTLVELDMIFIDTQGKIVKIHPRAKPHDETNVSSGQPVKATLEVLGGQAEKRGLQPGDTVRHAIFGNVLETPAPSLYKEGRP